ncbi:hypothetical protein BgAZ_300010 [Babesia gibsoni]|uniref:Uncharacterized protein n=1 Tax=Babesia gibsoni TaxID=33632 RepID=A0AAD8LJA8_BABGI|nr:hypothetical protein BgAZ_300010 [Babesia gibsoni]
MMLSAGFILPFLLYATAEEHVRKYKRLGEKDSSYFTDDTYPLCPKDGDMVDELGFWDKAIEFFGIPTTMENLGSTMMFIAFLEVFIATLIAAIIFLFTFKENRNSGSGGGSSGSSQGTPKHYSVKPMMGILIFILLGVAVFTLTSYIGAAIVYYTRGVKKLH